MGGTVRTGPVGERQERRDARPACSDPAPRANVDPDRYLGSMNVGCRSTAAGTLPQRSHCGELHFPNHLFVQRRVLAKKKIHASKAWERSHLIQPRFVRSCLMPALLAGVNLNPKTANIIRVISSFARQFRN